MRLFIFCTKKDNSVSQIVSAVGDLKVIVVNYEELSIINGVLWWEGRQLEIDSLDKIIIRWPWIIEQDISYDYNIFVQILVSKYYSQIVMDRKCLREHSPFYEDKLFQSSVFNDLGINTPKTWFFTNYEDVLSSNINFPLVFKKRVSGRSKHNIKTNSIDELKELLRDKNILDYIFQEYIEAKLDLRVIVLFDEILGSISRIMRLREGNRLTVSLSGSVSYDLQNKEIESDILKFASYLGADFVGFDLLIKEDGSYYFNEANLGLLFIPFSKATGINVGEKIIDKVIL